MRITLALSLLTTTAFTTPLLANDFYTSAPVIAATIYPQGALITREARVDVPGGTHRILIPFSSDSGFQTAPQVGASAGVQILSIAYLPERDFDPELLYTSIQIDTLMDIDELKEEIAAQKTSINTAKLAGKARQTELAFLFAIQPPADGASVEELSALADLVFTRTSAALTLAAEDARILDHLQWQLGEFEADLAKALRALDRLNLPAKQSDLLVVTIHTVNAQTASFTVENTGMGGWYPHYDIYLQTGDLPTLKVARSVMINRPSDWQIGGNEVWHDIALTLSSVRPQGQIAPIMPGQSIAQIYERLPPRPLSRVSAGAPMVEAMVMADGFAGPIVMTDSVAVTYTYPTKVTLGVEESVQLALDELSFPVETKIHASPRRDETAFFMARLSNESPEPLLPGAAAFYRDGHFMGNAALPMIPSGGDALLPFGPVEGLRLEHALTRNETGDTGVFTSANTRAQEITFSIENLTSKAQELTAFYPLVFSEQEDLTIAVRTTPRPDETDATNLRGLGAWHMTLAPGETQTVSIFARLDWPDGQELNWQP